MTGEPDMEEDWTMKENPTEEELDDFFENSVFRVVRDPNEPTMVEAKVINDTRLTPAELGVMAWLCSTRPGEVIPIAVQTRFGIGQPEAHAILNRLIELGHLHGEIDP